MIGVREDSWLIYFRTCNNLTTCTEVLDDYCHHEGTEEFIDGDSEARLTVEFHHHL